MAEVYCASEPCPLFLNSTCVFYTGESLLYIGVQTNDTLEAIIVKINQAFQNTGIGYAFTNGVIQPTPSQPVQLGGALIQNTTIGGNFTLTFSGNVQAARHITTGGSSSQFVKGDGTLDSTAYQPAANYITGLSGDATASGPGVAAMTLATVNFASGTFGNGNTIPIVTVNAKGLVTNITPTPINLPPISLTFVGDVVGSGLTGSNITLLLQNVNANPYTTITPLKFTVNGKGLVTSASPITASDIVNILGYNPGTSGTSGSTGTSGSSGTTGTSGTSATSGTSGTTGTSGTSATSGTSGTSGTDGTGGTSGTSGSTGTSGTAGTTGTSGSSGTTGTSGSSGTSGTTGTSGTSGTSGTTGTSGSSGLSGDRFKTTSTTTYTLQAPGNPGTLTVDPGLSYTVAQSIIIAFDANNHNEAEVTSYNSITGVINFVTFTLTGSGTYSSWFVNIDGASGGDGSSGSSGTSGTSATSGTSGTTGTSGSSGTSGTTGTSGSSGTSGTSATNGTGGTSGTSGTSGTNGTGGTSGTSGSSATSGTSGTSGTSVAVSGTTNTLAKFTSATTIGNSIVTDNGSLVSIGGALTTTGNITGAYILGSYFNSSAGNSENPTIGQIWTQNTSDNYLRKSTPAHFRSQITDGVYVPIRSQSNWNDATVINNVVGMLAWKNYGNGHVIFDASQGTSPSGGAVNQTNSAIAWSSSYPTLMGWNGSGTYGVRVDSARVADSAGSASTANYATSSTRLYATDNPYCFGCAAPYYMYMTYDGTRWFLQVSPATPSAVRVSYADVSGNTNSISSATGGAYTWTATNYFQSNLGSYSGVLSSPALQAWSSGSNSAFMSFHRSAIYAVNFGLDADNVLRMGGWSASANRWELDMSGNNTVAGSFRAPIFYDSANTAYYLDLASDISAIFAGSVGINNTSPVNANWGNSTNTKQLSINASDYAVINLQGSTSRKYSMGVGAGNFYMCYDNTAGRHNIIVNSSGNVSADVDFRAPIFYDSNDTTYYLDPNSTGLSLSSNGIVSSGGGTAGGFQNRVYVAGRNRIWSFGNADAYGISYFQGPDYIGLHFGTATQAASQFWVSDTGISQTSASSRAPIFYDSNNTGYYLDPASTSNLNVVQAASIRNDGSVATDDGFGIYWDNGASPAYGIFREAGAWSPPFPDLLIAFHTGIKLGANASYQGIRFYDDYTMVNEVMSVNNGSSPIGASHVYVNNVLQAGSSLRAPIFYDSNNTGYYLDPASGSYLNGVSTTNYLTASNCNLAVTGIAGQITLTTSTGFGGYFRATEHIVIENTTASYHVYVIGSNGVGVVKYYNDQFWSAQSDGRIKTVHSTLENNLSKLENINPIYYSFNNFDDDKNRIGLIAQEVQENFPELVNIDPKTDYLTVNYTGLIPVLLGAIKELKNKVETLETKIQ